LDAAQAAALQQRLEALGVRARVDRVGVGDDRAASNLRHSGLQLPLQQDPAESGLMHCPACGHAQLVAERCDECGVVFAEFNRHRRGTNAENAGQAPTTPPRPTVPQPPRRPREHDFHARANAQWEGGRLPQDEPPTEEYHVRLFMGPNATQLSDACHRMSLGRRTRLAVSWVGGAVFSPFLWAMYRKMWAWGALIFIAEILLPMVLITLGIKPGISGTFTYLGLALLVANRIFWPALLKSLYCRHTRRPIAYMYRMVPTYPSDIDIATRGGTSRTSVFVGLVIAIVITLLSWSVVDGIYVHFLAPTASFDAPVNLPSPAARSSGGDAGAPAPRSQDERLVNENKWVATRTRMRILAQRIAQWRGGPGRATDIADLRLASFASDQSLEPDSVRDGWGRPIDLQIEGESLRLISAGPDGKVGTADDVEYRRVLGR
ncbi:MAG: hypothetical protein WBM84_13560, partial [Sedimenticolaceae bacterium]